MLGDDGFYPPVTYSPMWVLLAVGIIALVVLVFVLVPLLTRRRRRPAPPELDTSWMDTLAPGTVNDKYLALIDDVERASARGELEPRLAHQRLSMLVRFYAYESTGVRAPQMTLADLRENQLGPLTEAVDALYPGAFSGRDRSSVPEAARLAREVVRSWS